MKLSSNSLLRLALPLAFFLAAVFFADAQADLDAARDTRFLAFLATVGLIAVGALEHRTTWVLPSASLGAMLIVWALPASDERAALLPLLLVTAATLALADRLRARIPQAERVGVALAVAVGLQALTHPEHLLRAVVDAELVIGFCLLPAVAAFGFARLARRKGPLVWLAAPLAVVGGGITPELALTVALVAAVEALPDDRRGAALWSVLSLATAATGVNEPLWLATSAIAAGFAIRPTRTRILLAVFLGAGLGADLVLGGRLDTTALATLALLLPAALALQRPRRGAALLAVALALAASSRLGPAAALGPALLLAAALSTAGPRLRLQIAWSATLGVGGTLAAGYPWLRSAPLESAVSWGGLGVDLASAALVLAVFWTVALAIPALGAEPAWAPRAALLATAAGLGLGLLPSPMTVTTQPFVLTAAASTFESPVDGNGSAVLVHSHLSNAATLEPGTPVARVIIQSDGKERMYWIESGTDTADWAARRPTLAGRIAAPEPWLTWPAGDGPYLGQRYRLHWRLEADIPIDTFRIERSPALPPETALTVVQVDIE